MKKEIFYKYNYYDIQRREKELKFFELLSNSNLFEIISPSLDLLVDRIFLKVTSDEMTSDFNSLIIRGEDANKKTWDLLSVDPNIQKIDDIHSTSCLFTNAFIKLCNRVFLKDGHNDEKLVIQTQLHEWLEEILAKKITKDNRFKHFQIITNLLDQLELLHKFYSIFVTNIPLSWIEEEPDSWLKHNYSITDMLDYLRPYEKDYFTDYEKEINKNYNLSKWNYTLQATRSSDNFLLNRKVSFVNNVLINKYIDKWLNFWDNLKYPIIQDIPFHYIQNPETICKIFIILNKNKNTLTSDIKVLAYILLKNLFITSLKTSENLFFYNDSERINRLSSYEKNDAILKFGKRIFYLWKRENANNYIKSIESLSGILSYDEISEWFFSYQQTENSAKNNNIRNKEIETISNAYKTIYESANYFDNTEGLESNFNLQKFNYIVSIIDPIEIKSETAEKIIEYISSYINTDGFYWDQSFSPMYWNALKGIGKVLCYTASPIETSFKLIEKYLLKHEGWNVKFSDYKLSQKESFIFCGCTLLLEHNSPFKDKATRNKYYRNIVDLLIKQARYTQSDLNFNYKTPLYLLYLVSNQIMSKNQKEYFDNQLIKNIDNLECLIEIFSSEKFQLSKKSKLILEKRVQNEYGIIRMRMSQTKQIEKLDNIEKSLSKIGLNIN